MSTVRNKIEGPVTVTNSLELQGMITGDTTVAAGGRLLLEGMCCKDLIVESGGEVQLNGMVSGNVYNRGGLIKVQGRICGFLMREAGDAVLAPVAVIEGGVKP